MTLAERHATWTGRTATQVMWLAHRKGYCAAMCSQGTISHYDDDYDYDDDYYYYHHHITEELRWAKSRESCHRVASESYRCDSNR